MIFVFGHRGATGNARENTIAAFARAVELEADGVELDVRITTDGALVVHHDAVVDTGVAIASARRDELPEYVPSLEAALEVCAGIRVNVEVKNLPNEPGYDPTAVVAVRSAEVVARMGRIDDVLMSSFDLATIDAVRTAVPELATGWLTLSGYDQHRALAAATERGHVALHPQAPSITSELVVAAHEAGVQVVAWTVNDPARMHELDEMGVDVLITDDVPLALSVLRG